MAALDTNILVRFLVRDEASQLALAQSLLRRCASAGELLFVPITVALELEWVLRSVFRFDKQTVVNTFGQLLGTFELHFESEGALEAAVATYAGTDADFSDCLHAALAGMAGEQPMWTFDKAAARVEGAALLST